MLRKILKLLGYLLLVVFIVVTLSFSARQSRYVACRIIQIELRENEQIRISKEEIARLVHKADNNIIGKELRMINTDIIEKEIEKHQAILKAEVYKVIVADSSSYSGILGVKVIHREPVLRIMSSQGNYYLDKTGERIPVTISYTANVIVATGDFSEEFARKELLPFVLFLNGTPFWKAQIKQVHVERNGDVLLIPLVGDQIIEMGSLKGYPEKLRNMRAFYEQVMARNNWDKYKHVSVKYKDQVIAKKR
jgi:cell division protein FtsQ